MAMEFMSDDGLVLILLLKKENKKLWVHPIPRNRGELLNSAVETLSRSGHGLANK